MSVRNWSGPSAPRSRPSKVRQSAALSSSSSSLVCAVLGLGLGLGSGSGLGLELRLARLRRVAVPRLCAHVLQQRAVALPRQPLAVWPLPA